MRYLAYFCLILVLLLSVSQLYAQTTYEDSRQEKQEYERLLNSLIQKYENGEVLSDEQINELEKSGYFFSRPTENPELLLDEITSTLFTESFDYADLNGLTAAGWTVLDGGDAGPAAPWNTWSIQTDHRSTEHSLGDTSPFIIVDSDRAGSYNMDEAIITPALDATFFYDLTLSFDYAYKGYSAPNEQGDVDYSIDGGTTWTNLVIFITPRTQVNQEYPYQIALPANVNGSSDLRIRFRYHGANYDYWWGIDNISIIGSQNVGIVDGNITDFDTALPLEGANVLIEGTSLSTTSGVDGFYELLDIPESTISITYSKIGYHSQTIDNIVVVPDEIITQDIVLVEATFDISGTVTSVGNVNLPVEGAIVELIELELSTTTDQDGFYSFESVGAGSHILNISPDNSAYTPWCHDEQFIINLDEDTVYDITIEEIMAPQALSGNSFDETTVELFWAAPANHNAASPQMLNHQIDEMLQANERILSEGTPEELAKHDLFTRELNILIKKRDLLEKSGSMLDDIDSNFLGYRIYIDGILQPLIIQDVTTQVSNLNAGQEYSFDVAADYGYGDEFLIPTDLPISIRPLPSTESFWTYEEVPYEWIEINPSEGGAGLPIPNWGDDENSGWLEWGTGQTFTLYDVEETGFHVCSNGWISLERASAGNTAIRPRIPSTSSPNLTVALLGIDQDTGDRDCGYWYQIDPDNDQVIVQFHNRYYSNTDPLYIYQGVFNTDENTITMSYNTAGPSSEWHGHSPVETGVENAGGSQGSVLPNSSIANNTSFQFYYRPPISEWVAFQGQVINEHDDSLVEGVEIRAVSTVNELYFTATSDSLGNYQILVDRDIGPYDIYYSHIEYEDAVDIDVSLDPGEFHTTHDKSLVPIGSISGTVFDQLTQEPVPFAEINVQTVDGENAWSITSDENGYFEFVRLFDRSVSYNISADREEYMPGDDELVEFQDTEFNIVTDLYLNPLGSISGTITDFLSLDPVPYAAISIEESDSDNVWTFNANADGFFESGPLFDRFLRYNYTARYDGYVPGNTDAIRFSETETAVNVDLSIDPLGTIFGIVTDTVSNPAADIILTLTNTQNGIETTVNSLEDGGFSFDRICSRTDIYELSWFGEGWNDGLIENLTFDPHSYTIGPIEIELVPSAYNLSPTILSTDTDFDNGFMVEALPEDLYGEHSTIRYDDGVVSGTTVLAGNGPGNSFAVLIDNGSPFYFFSGGFRLPTIGDDPIIPDPTHYPVVLRIHGVGPDGLPDDNILYETTPIAPDESSYWAWFEPGIEIVDGRCWLSIYRLEGSGNTGFCIDGTLDNPGVTAGIDDNGNWVGMPLAGDPVMEVNTFTPTSSVGEPLIGVRSKTIDIPYGHINSETKDFQPALFGRSIGKPAGPTPSRTITISNILGLDELTGMNFYYSFDGSDYLLKNVEPVYDDSYFYEFTSELENTDIYFQVTALNDIDGELIESDPTEPQLVTFNLSPSPVNDLVGSRVDYVVDLSWTAPLTNEDGSPIVDLTGYNIYRSGELIATIDNPATLTYQDVIDPEVVGNMYYWVTAVDEVPNESIVSLYNAGIIGAPLYTDSFEPDSANGWMFMNAGETFNTAGLEGENLWEVGVPTSGPGAAQDGIHVLSTNLAGNYDNNQLMAVKSLVVEVLNNKAAFSYWHYFGYESGIDGYNVWASTDDGDSWEILTPLGGYPRNVSAYNGYFSQSYVGFTGSITGWQEVFVPLGDYYTEDERTFVNIAFLHTTDVSVTNVGAYIDNISFYEAGPSWGYPLLPFDFETTYPEDGASVPYDTVTVSWTPASDPNQFDSFEYTVEWSLNSDFTSSYSETTTDTFFVIEEVIESLAGGDQTGDGQRTNQKSKHVISPMASELKRGQISHTPITNQLDELPEDNTIYWRVFATASSDGFTFWANNDSSGCSFTVDHFDTPSMFDLVSPLDGSINTSSDAVLVWNRSSDPDLYDTPHYDVWLDTFEDLSTAYMVADSSADTTITINIPFDDHTYFWTVRATDSNTAGMWANDTSSFVSDIPEQPLPFSLISPENGIELDTLVVTFFWYETSDPDPYDTPYYDVWLDTLEDLSTAWMVADSSADTTITISNLPNNHTYFWTVRATDSNTSGRWAIDTYSFSLNVIGPPLPFGLVSPDSGVVLDTLVYTFTWEETSDPDPEDEITYLLSLSLAEDFEDTMSVYYIANTNDHFPVPYLRDDSDYWWRVIASDEDGNMTISSDIWTFETAWPEPPFDFEMIECGMLFAEGADSVDINVSWNRAYDPDPESEELYAIYIDIEEDMTNQVLLADNVSPPASTDTLYAWTGRVALADIPGGDGDDFYLTVHALDSNTDGTWASNIVGTHLSAVFENSFYGIPTEYEITALYPNPFNPTLTAVIALPFDSDLRVVVYNLMGREVAVLTNRQHRAGYHSLVFDGSGLSSGVYFVHATVQGKLNQVQKVVLMK